LRAVGPWHLNHARGSQQRLQAVGPWARDGEVRAGGVSGDQGDPVEGMIGLVLTHEAA